MINPMEMLVSLLCEMSLQIMEEGAGSESTVGRAGSEVEGG